MWRSLQICDLKIGGHGYMPVAILNILIMCAYLFTAKVSSDIQSGLTSSNYSSKFTVRHILQ